VHSNALLVFRGSVISIQLFCRPCIHQKLMTELEERLFDILYHFTPTTLVRLTRSHLIACDLALCGFFYASGARALHRSKVLLYLPNGIEQDRRRQGNFRRGLDVLFAVPAMPAGDLCQAGRGPIFKAVHDSRSGASVGGASLLATAASAPSAGAASTTTSCRTNNVRRVLLDTPQLSVPILLATLIYGFNASIANLIANLEEPMHNIPKVYPHRSLSHTI
jgi:hypothetical protein